VTDDDALAFILAVAALQEHGQVLDVGAVATEADTAPCATSAPVTAPNRWRQACALRVAGGEA